MDPAFMFLALTTVGPPHLSLPEEIRCVVYNLIRIPKTMLVCSKCTTPVLQLTMTNTLVQAHQYYMLQNGVVCHACSKWNHTRSPVMPVCTYRSRHQEDGTTRPSSQLVLVRNPTPGWEDEHERITMI